MACHTTSVAITTWMASSTTIRFLPATSAPSTVERVPLTATSSITIASDVEKQAFPRQLALLRVLAYAHPLPARSFPTQPTQPARRRSNDLVRSAEAFSADLPFPNFPSLPPPPSPSPQPLTYILL